LEKIEEIDSVENQIDWFEKTRVDPNKRPRYANMNLKETFNYDECLHAKLALKREEKLKKEIQQQKRASMQVAASAMSSNSNSASAGV